MEDELNFLDLLNFDMSNKTKVNKVSDDNEVKKSKLKIKDMMRARMIFKKGGIRTKKLIGKIKKSVEKKEKSKYFLY